MTKNQTARLVLITAAAVFASILPAAAQSLGDLARQEAARRKDVKAPAKVFTNDNLKGMPPAAPPVLPGEPGQPGQPGAQPAAPAAAAAEAADAKPPEAPDPMKDPEYWRKRMSDAREARDRNAFLLEAVQSRINALTTDFYARDDPYQRAQIELDRNKSLAELERMKKRQLELEKAIGDIEEEARRANIPPGWLR
jgi:hypothetical protein